MDFHQPTFSSTIIVIEDLILKSVCMSDATAFFKIIRENQDHFSDFDFISPNFESLKGVEDVIRSLIDYKDAGNGVNYGLWRRNELIGLFTVNKVSWDKKEADVGFWLTKPATRQGLAKLAFQAFCNDLIGLGFRRLTATTAISNEHAQSLLSKVGFNKIDEHKGSIIVRGQKIDEFLFVLSVPSSVSGGG